jgi:precorrin-6B methylase 2
MTRALLSALVRADAHHIADWLRTRFRHGSAFELGLPWLSWPAVDFLKLHLHPGMRVLEFGGGGSTEFFLSRGCDVVTVERSMEWVDKIHQRVDRIGGAPRWRLTYVPESAAPFDYFGSLRMGPWNVILIDAAYRLGCLEAARDCLTRDGMILFDNADLDCYSTAPSLMEGLSRLEFAGLGVGRKDATKTDVYYRALPNQRLPSQLGLRRFVCNREP